MSYAIGVLSGGSYGIGVYQSEAPDTAAPTLQSARITDTVLRLTFDEPVSIGAGGNAGWALTLSGGAATATYSGGSGTRYLYYTVSRSVAADETGTIDYTQPGDGIEDVAGNDLESIVSEALSVGGASGGGGFRLKNSFRVRF